MERQSLGFTLEGLTTVSLAVFDYAHQFLPLKISWSLRIQCLQHTTRYYVTTMRFSFKFVDSTLLSGLILDLLQHGLSDGNDFIWFVLWKWMGEQSGTSLPSLVLFSKKNNQQKGIPFCWLFFFLVDFQKQSKANSQRHNLPAWCWTIRACWYSTIWPNSLP